MTQSSSSGSASGNPIMTHQSVLSPAGAHDAHLYDPRLAQDHHLLAVFETLAGAEAARSALVAAGIAAGCITLADHTGEAAQTGFWTGLKQALIPDQDAEAYAESVQRGHAVLVVQPDPAEAMLVIETLDAAHPLDFDAQLAAWREAGWQQMAAQHVETGTAAPVDAIAAASARTTATGQQAALVQSAAASGHGQPVPGEALQPRASNRLPHSSARVQAYGTDPRNP